MILPLTALSRDYRTNMDFPVDQDDFEHSDIDYIRSKVQRRGGFHSQYECVVETPAQLRLQLVRTYRSGTDNLDDGRVPD